MAGSRQSETDPRGDSSDRSRPASPRLSPSSGDCLHAVEEDSFNCMWGIVEGVRVYGVVDIVPDVLHVGTVFWHLFWIPVLPLQSWVFVVDQLGCTSGVGNTPIRLCVRSVLLAWGRLVGTALALGTGLAGAGAGVAAIGGRGNVAAAVVLLAACALLLVSLRLARRLQIASPENAARWAALAGFPPEVVSRLEESVRLRDGGPDDRLVKTRPCPVCGRPLAWTTPVYPRCEHRPAKPEPLAGDGGGQPARS